MQALPEDYKINGTAVAEMAKPADDIDFTKPPPSLLDQVLVELKEVKRIVQELASP